MPTINEQSLQAWTCVKCGAALPAEAATGELVTCGYCGTPFSLPTAKTRCDGVTVSGGAMKIGGDVIGGSKRVIFTSEVPSATRWDEPDSSDDDAGVSIDGDDIQIYGDMVGGSVVRIAPVRMMRLGLDFDLTSDEKLATPERVVEPAKPIAPALKLGWWEKIKRLFGN